jgi:hypothetical protein
MALLDKPVLLVLLALKVHKVILALLVQRVPLGHKEKLVLLVLQVLLA